MAATAATLRESAVASLSELDARRQQQEADEVGITSTEVFSDYRPTQSVPGRPHPADIAEAASLAATATPELSYPMHESIPAATIEDGTLSSLQLEGVILACQRHLTILPTTPPSRAAFFLGDGAGVGKGRQLSGIILDSLARGRLRHLWFSTSGDLRVDAMRDLRCSA